jgi:hypothetical protein
VSGLLVLIGIGSLVRNSDFMVAGGADDENENVMSENSAAAGFSRQILVFDLLINLAIVSYFNLIKQFERYHNSIF